MPVVRQQEAGLMACQAWLPQLYRQTATNHVDALQSHVTMAAHDQLHMQKETSCQDSLHGERFWLSIPMYCC